MSPIGTPSVRGCLKVLGIITPSDEAIEIFGDCEGDLEQEFATLKKIYFRKILKEHPDKGGDPNTFRRTRSAFEILRERRTKNDLQISFLDEEELIKDDGGNSNSTDTPFDQEEFFRREAERASGSSSGVPSYEYYYEAAQETVPGYRVELAKSKMSRCAKCKRTATSNGRKKKTKATTTTKKGKATQKKKDPLPPSTQAAPTAPPPTALVVVSDDVPITTTGRRTRAMTRALTTKSTAKANATKTTTKAVVAKTSAATTVSKFEDATLIPKDAIRVGSLDKFAGTYGRWHHLPCWRVPYRIWAGLTDPRNKEQVWLDLLSMDEILLTNVSSLLPPKNAIKNSTKNDEDDEDDVDDGNKELFVAHVMDRNNWARKTKSSKPPPDLEQLRKEQDEKMKAATATTTSSKKRSVPPASEGGNDDDDDDRKPVAATSISKKGTSKKKKAKKSAATNGSPTDNGDSAAATTVAVSSSTALVTKKKKPLKKAFKIPHPGVNGAADSTLYDGKTFVMTGTFPEIGGGIGLDLGKSKVKALIQSFGGRVTSAVSGKTDYLVVGKDPGASKVNKAMSRNLPRIGLKSLGDNIYNIIPSLEQAPTPVITNFSAGYSRSAYLEY